MSVRITIPYNSGLPITTDATTSPSHTRDIETGLYNQGAIGAKYKHPKVSPERSRTNSPLRKQFSHENLLRLEEETQKQEQKQYCPIIITQIINYCCS